MIKAFLDYASQRYYAGNPIISDDEFDKLAEAHNYERVGTPSVRDGVPHAFSMYSLQKCYVGEKPIELKGDVEETLKIDGAAAAVTYVNRKYVLGLTRGDGKRGQDITEKIRHLVPAEIDRDGLVQITGEIAAPKSIPNARNYAAGALNLKDIEEIKSRDLTFIAYGVSPVVRETWKAEMGWLETQGFYDVSTYTFQLSQGWVRKEFPTDGKVFRLNNNKAFEAAGYTANHPRGAYALKERQEGVITVLKDVVWQVGRSGVVSPVAILDPVKVGDAVVSRATLHNIKYIEELGLELDCKVEIVRAGHIIPRVVRRVD